MPTIDDKVVAMSFESSKFEQGVNKTISALDKLKAALTFGNAGKGLSDIDAAAKRVDLGHIARGVESVKQALGTLRLVAIAVFAQIAQAAARAGLSMVKALTLDPVIAGFNEYALNLQSIQTILANTEVSGANLQDVNAALDELNRYSDKTIYNFAQMAKNIGTFTAAGVDLDSSTAAIKGIANLAALSGSTADQASTAMYQLSQALSAGRVTLMDWNSVVNAGMGGAVFQRALATTAEAMGTLKKGTVELTGPMKTVTIAGESFRNSLSAGPGKDSWLTSKVLTNTLKQFTSDLTDAQLAAMGFNKAQIAAIQQTAKTAMHAATEVKTIKQVFDVAKETAGSGWAQTFRIIFGNFEEAKKTFTALSNTINGFINKNAEARNKVLSDWKALGGRTVLINSIKTAFQNLGAILKPIKEAFRDIFPAATGQSLLKLTWQFRNFAHSLKPSQQTIDNLKSTFRGFFAFLDIGKQIIGGFFSMLGRLFGAVGIGEGGFLKFTASIGDFIYKLDQSLKKGDGIAKFFEGLGDILAKPIELISKLADAIGNLFDKFSPGEFAGNVNEMTSSLDPFHRMVELVTKAWDKFVTGLEKSAKGGFLSGLSKLFGGIGTFLGNMFENMNFESLLAVVRTGLFAGLVLMFREFLGKGSFLSQISQGFAGGVLGNFSRMAGGISGLLNGLQGTLVTFQNNIKAKTLKEIAIAVALLSASIVALSLADPEKVSSAMGTMTIMFGELLGAMAIMNKIALTAGFLKLPFVAGAMILLAGAIDILTIAVFALSKLSWDELKKGLIGVGALLGGITAAAIPLGAAAPGLIRAGVGINAIAFALNILALAVRQLGSMDMKSLGKGLGGVAAGLGGIAAGMAAMPKGMILQAVALNGIAVALNIISLAVSRFADLSWQQIAKGMAGLAGSLAAIAAAMHAMPKGMILQAAALVVVSLSLNKIAAAIERMGSLSIKTLAKGLIALGGVLLVLAGGLTAMSGTLMGAISLGVAALGITLLSKALVRMGKMSWKSMIKSLIMLAGALGIIAIAAVALTPAAPALLAFGVAMLAIGAGLALAGAGIFLIGLGLSALAVSGPAAIGVLVAAMREFLRGIIENAKLIVEAVLSIVKAFAEAAPQFVEAGVEFVKAFLQGIIKIMPMLVPAITAIVDMVVQVLDKNAAKIIKAGFDLLIEFLKGIRNAIPQIVRLVADIIVNFLNALTRQLPRIIDAGVRFMFALATGIMKAMITLVPSLTLKFITDFIRTLVGQFGKILTTGGQLVARLVAGILGKLGTVLAAGARAIVDFVRGMASRFKDVLSSGVRAVLNFVSGVSKTIPRVILAAGGMILAFALEIAAAIGRVVKGIFNAAKAIGSALIEGAKSGITSLAESLYSKVRDIAGKVVGFLKKPWSVFSPSRVTMYLGEMLIKGLVIGLDTNASQAYRSAIALSQGVIDSVKKTFQITSPSKVMEDIGKFVVQGFAKGLRGTTPEIIGALREMDSKLLGAMKEATKNLEAEYETQRKLLAADKFDAKAWAKTEQVIRANQKAYADASIAHQTLTQALDGERKTLIKLSRDYEVVSNKLKAAQEKLAAAKKEMDDFTKSLSDKFGELPELPELLDENDKEIDQLAAYEESLKKQIEATEKYAETLAKLRELGLDDATYKKLLDEGPDAQAFASALLAGGKTAVDGINELDRRLKAESDKLAKAAAKELYQAGVDAAQGLVNGLASEKKQIAAAMKVLIEDIIAIIKKELGIQSPSRVMMGIGDQMAQGIVKGLSGAVKMVENAAVGLVDSALTAMNKSFDAMSTMVMGNIDANPVITPVLDLTMVRSQAKELGYLTNVTPITAAASYGQASRISSAQARSFEEQQLAIGGTHVSFEQNNYSPSALTEIEIYRQTKNSLSQLKSSLNI